MSQPRVILSYSRSDETLIRRIQSDLHECGIDAWLDRSDIEPGHPIRQAIFEALSTVDALFAYLTPESKDSKWVRAELDAAFLQQARDKGFRALPFVNSTDTIPLLRADIADILCPVISFEQYELGLRKLIKAVTDAANERKFWQFHRQVEYVLQPTLRGITLLDSVKNVGLVDIENRDDRDHLAPPNEFYGLAKKELFISGITAQWSFENAIHTLRDTLEAGKLLRVLIMHPDSDVIPWLTKREEREGMEDIGAHIEDVIRKVHLNGFADHPNFSMRLMDKFPTFTAIMLDGDIEKSFKEPMPDVQLRMQPTTIYKTQHGGLVIQSKKTLEIPFPLFDFVAEELREQWAHAIDIRKR
ncbi:toll/interleukin-1 receptor domain-containing protein [Candidatus Microgenomates bacterium]|nr:toll/interleukin-1 receptor domain-containing protein [Candidatus Microgenomates bacterium]